MTRISLILVLHFVSFRTSILFICFFACWMWVLFFNYVVLKSLSLFMLVLISTIFFCVINIVLLKCSDGGYFNAIMSFPSNYPLSPPTVKFTSEVWHPNGWSCNFLPPTSTCLIFSFDVCLFLNSHQFTKMILLFAL